MLPATNRGKGGKGDRKARETGVNAVSEAHTQGKTFASVLRMIGQEESMLALIG